MSTSEDTTDYVCPVYVSSGKCGEQDALRVMQQFKDFYETKLSEVHSRGGGDCLELKLKIQRRWIDDLTEQTQMMARIVKELEEEATLRVKMLEDKLKQTSKSAYEVMKRYQNYSISHNLDEPFQKIFYLENDVKNLLEFVRRGRDDNRWSIEGLQFYDVTYKDLFGKEQECDCKDSVLVPLSNGLSDGKPIKEAPPKTEDEKPQEEVSEQLRRKTEDYEILKQNMLDMRSALTEEVACKHDMISALKKDVQQLEERCVQADKQTAFKDDIIKELRKEIKQLKKQNKDKEGSLEEELRELRARIKHMRPCVEVKSIHTMMDDDLVIKKSKLIQNKDEIIQIQNDTLNVIQTELQDSKKKDKALAEKLRAKDGEMELLKCRCVELEKALGSAQGRADNLQKAVDLYLNSINVLEASEERARIEMEQQKTTIANLQEALVGVKQELDELRQNNQQEVQNQQYLNNVLYVNLLDSEERNEALSAKLSQLRDSYSRLQDCNFELEVQHFNSLQDLSLFEVQLYKYQTEIRSLEDLRNEIRKLRHQNRSYEHIIDCFKHEMAVMSEQLTHLHDILNLSNLSCCEENSQLYKALKDLQKLSDKLHQDLIDSEKKVMVENKMNQLKDAKIGELEQIIGRKNEDLNIHDEAIQEMKVRLEHAIIENHELQATIVALNSRVVELKCDGGRASCQGSLCHFKEKNNALEKLQAEYKRQYQLVRTMQSELERVKEKNKQKNRELKKQNDELRESLKACKVRNQQLQDELAKVQDNARSLAEKDLSREQELAQNKQVILELRQTLIELNENLAASELHQLALKKECHKMKTQENREQDVIVEKLKGEVVRAKENLSTVEEQNKKLMEALKNKDLKFAETQKKTAQKEKEIYQYVKELSDKLRRSQEEEKRLSDFIDSLKQEVQEKLRKKNEKRDESHPVACECCDCAETTDSQDEITELKSEIKKMIQNQLELNAENDRLLSQVTNLQDTVATLEDKVRNLKQKLAENQNLKEKIKALAHEKDLNAQTIKNLELELDDVRNKRDDVFAESRGVVNNVKAWLEEQKRINDKVKKRTQCYCDTIIKLKQENEQLSPTAKRKFLGNSDPWGLGSQGTESVSPRDSPSSFMSCSVEEWYSPNYKDEDETVTDHDDEFVNRLEAITREMKNSNKKWRDKCKCSVVSRDSK